MPDSSARPEIDQLTAQAGYDRWSEIYDSEDNPLIALEEPRIDALLGAVSGLCVIDIGCGTGRHALRLAARGARVSGVDLSEGMLARARAKPGAERIDFRHHDLHAPLPYADASFDAAVSGLVLEHVRDLELFFRELRRVSKPGASAVISAMHPAMHLRGISARFTDPKTGRETRPHSQEHSISDYVTAALGAGLVLTHLSEHAVDAALAATSPRAVKYIGWPMLLLMRLECPAPRA